MFLIFLRTNLSEFLFKKVIYHLASEIPETQRDNKINEQLDKKALPSTSEVATLDEVDTPLLKKVTPNQVS